MKITFYGHVLSESKSGDKHILVDPLSLATSLAEHIDIDSLKAIIFY
jgi:hypothetical protein